MAEVSLGKASLDLEANLDEFRRNIQSGRGDADQFKGTLDSLAAVAKIAEDALQQVKMTDRQSAESSGAA